MKPEIRKGQSVAFMLLMLVFLLTTMASRVGSTEELQRSPNQEGIFADTKRAAEFLEPYGWIIQQVVTTEDFILPDSLVPSIDQEETIYWAVINECLKAVNMDLTPCLGKEIRATQYSAMHPATYSATAVFILELDGEVIGAYTREYGGFTSITRKSFSVLQTDPIEWLREITIATSHIPKVDQKNPLAVAEAYLDARINEDAETALALTDIIYIYNILAWPNDDMRIMGVPLRIVYQGKEITRILSSATELSYSSLPDNERYYEFQVEYATDNGEGLNRPMVLSLIEDEGTWKVYKASEYF